MITKKKSSNGMLVSRTILMTAKMPLSSKLDLQ